MTSVAIATCAAFPELEHDDQLLLTALRTQGAHAHPEIWTDESVDWATYDLVLVRSTWDYSDHHDAFLAWCRRVSEVSRLVNPAELISWNTDKIYLRELAAGGIPIVPTAFISSLDHLQEWLPPTKCETFVVKPSVSAGSRGTMRYRLDDGSTARARQHLAEIIVGGKTAMVQPYLDAVDDLGETAQMFIDGEFSHAIRKGPLLQIGADGERVNDLYLQEYIEARTAEADERQLAERILKQIPGGVPMYARVDLIRAADGSPVLLELELCEPSLFFLHCTGSADRLARAVLEYLSAE